MNDFVVTPYEHELEAWKALLASGQVTHVRPRRWCGAWQLHAYNHNLPIPLIGSIGDSEQAMQAVRDAKVSIEDILA